jgi:hypothetical protein
VLRLVATLREAGYQPEEYVLSFVDFETHLGGAFFNEEADLEVILTTNPTFPGRRI